MELPIDRYIKLVYKFAKRTNDPDEAASALLETLAKCLATAPQHEPARMYVVIDWLRTGLWWFGQRQTRHERLVLLEPVNAENVISSRSNDPAVIAMGKIAYEELMHAIQQLPISARRVMEAWIELHDEKGAYKRVAERLGWAVGTVKSQLHRAREALEPLTR